MILAFILGAAFGGLVIFVVMDDILREQNRMIYRWHRLAMEYLELWMADKERRKKERHDDRDEADWWKE